jgi:hypothetical protein
MRIPPTEKKQPDSRREYWQQQIARQEQSGQSVKAFCQSQGLTEQSFYWWRKRLEGSDVPVRFALVQAGTNGVTSESALELVLSSGDRLRIGADVNANALRTVLAVLRERA